MALLAHVQGPLLVSRQRQKTAFSAGGYTVGGATARLKHKIAAIRAQGEACPLCNSAFEPEGRRQPAMDSDDNSEVRGVLCQACNRAVGGFGHDILTHLRVAQYLLEHEMAHGRTQPGDRELHAQLEEMLGEPPSRRGMVAMLAVSTRDMEMASLANSQLASSWEARSPKQDG